MKLLKATMVRNLIVTICCCVLFVNQILAQSYIGRQLVDQYPTTAWNTMTYGLTWLPTDYYNNPSARYPLIIFLHGSGEGGDGEWGLYNLITQGLPMTIANGFNPEAVSPVTGQNTKFIVVSPQAPGAAHWSYGFGNVQYILADVLARYRVDASRIYVTGLSAGGAGTWSCVTNGPDFAQKIAAIVPVSSAGTNTSAEYDAIPLVGGTYGVKVWSTAGSNESWLSFAQNATNMVNSASPPVPAKVTAIPGVTHEPAGWNRPYDPNWRENEMGRNIYEWMLQYSRNGQQNVPVNLPPVSQAGGDQTITLPQNSITLSGYGTDADGYITTHEWSLVNGPSTPSFSSTNSAQVTVSNLVQGSYTFRLKVTDNAWATATDDLVVKVDPQPVSTNPGNSNRIEAEHFSSMSGIQTENTADEGGGQNVAWQDDNDWMDYSINPSSTGIFQLNFRVASMFSNPQFQLRKADGTLLATISVPNTGGFQTWQTVSAQVMLSAGPQTVRIYTSRANGGWNINWWEIKGSSEAVNQAPSVYAGSSQTITLPLNTINLSGSASDADGSISSYSWSQVSGPAQASFTSAQSAQTGVNNLVEGNYSFRLTVSDNMGAQASSDVSVSVLASGGTPGSSSRIEAEHFTSMNGIQTENTSDDGGGQNVAWQDDNDWMDYSVNVSSAGTYTVNFRVATMFNGAQFQLRNSNGSVLATINVPNTGWFQTWQTVSAQVSLPAGQQTLRIVTTNAAGGWNINWWEIQGASGSSSSDQSYSSRIEAENFSAMNGIQTENTADDGGGQNVGWQDDNDWMDYSVQLSSSGTYTVNFRVASMFQGAQFQLRNANGSVLATISVPNTGGFQTWQTVSAQVWLPSGQQTLRIVTSQAAGGWNINWWEITNASTVSVASNRAEEIVTTTGKALDIFPNPVTDRFALKVNNELTGSLQLQVFDMSGNARKTFVLNKNNKGIIQTYLSLGNLPKGEYLLKVTMANWTQTSKVIKL